jgi:UDP-N-acetylmuramoyl-L-alanyl-D-glutamate--2,6-diaminopimelate ligase
MGEVAARYSDRIILTNDNPRYEEPEQIVNDIKQGIPATYLHLQVEMDRAIAIEYAIAHAKCDDIILIAGKGHESYQQIRDQRVFFSDQAIVTQCLKIRGIELS